VIVKLVCGWQNAPVPMERLTPERRRQLTRDSLISAAREVFTRKGFHAASLEEIAEAAGFTRGAIYSNFGSKEELLFAVIDRFDNMGLVGIADAVEAEAASGPTSAALAAAGIWQKLLYRPEEIMALSLELRLFALRNPEARRRLAELERQTSDKLTAFIEETFTHRRIPAGRARQVAALGRAAVDGLEQMAAVDEENAGYYRELVSSLFLLLARILEEPPADAQQRGPDGA
jgi:AcrR family transcriptional regulator